RRPGEPSWDDKLRIADWSRQLRIADCGLRILGGEFDRRCEPLGSTFFRPNPQSAIRNPQLSRPIRNPQFVIP
ncbi:MAG TPA: hypothetical protein VEU55_06435, partial [Gemmatimonadales bacterium]|nr:hypothetical protein [Gemmatimonadales bacterium]